ncbi:hypothetical protein COV13_01580 [Candidatus Woesearchaeota archaeon CG10_big_fil_rev_8_21_14_0_10_32_9]|nr:MAG: hypothetical protein COV13_01580 [Candidatus Woesearchaeota archaeon CG10_big_fil_rev_8_21_14_0_10_32_9]
MQKKEEASLISKSVNKTVSAFKNVVFGREIHHAVNEIKSEIDETIKDAKKSIDKSFEKLMTHIIIFFLIMAGLIFAFLGLAYFFIEQLNFSSSSAFLVIGILILALGWFFLREIKKK